MKRDIRFRFVILIVLGCAGCAAVPIRNPFVGLRRSTIQDRELSMARLMERHGKHDESSKLYRHVLQKDPRNTVALHRLGVLAARQGDLDVALEHFERARKTADPSAELLNDIGYAYYLKDDLTTAATNLEAAIRVNPHYSAARTNLGLVLAEQEKFDEALVEFRKSVSEAAALSNLAFIQTKLGRLGAAEKNYHRALDLDQTQRPAAEALVQFQTLRNQAEILCAKRERHEPSGEGLISSDIKVVDASFYRAVSTDEGSTDAGHERAVPRPIVLVGMGQDVIDDVSKIERIVPGRASVDRSVPDKNE